MISFDLPVTIDSTRLAERERLRKRHLDAGVAKGLSHQIDDFFPTSLISPQPETFSDSLKVKRPHLWLDSSASSSAGDTGRYWRYPREELVGLLPEGLAGELSRDVFLMPSRTRDIGIMHRKATQEIMFQMGLMEGLGCVPKRGWLLEGKRGTGKSAILTSVVAWARQRGWIVLFEPLGSRWGKEICEITRSSTGVYLQNDLAVQFLDRFLRFNRPMLQALPVNLSFYGRTAIDGSPIETVERVYLPLIEKAVAEKNPSSISSRLEEVHRLRKMLKTPSMKDRLAVPTTVLDMCEFGINNVAFATQAVAELITQLKVQEAFPVLIALDEFNELFPVSEYVSTRYDNTSFNGYIPSYHLALPRMLSRWDGHEFKRGLKLYATTWNRRNRRQWDPTILGIKPEEIKQVRNFTKEEFAFYCAYQALTNTSHNFPQAKLEYFYMLTQGNGFEARRIMATLY